MPKDAYLESRVLAADPVELIHMLYEHALLQLRVARTALAVKDVPSRSTAIAKVLAILGELEGSLDFKAGGAITQNLSRLYRYMRKRLVEANVGRLDAPLAEVESLLRTLDEGWTAMQHKKPVGAPMPYAESAVDQGAHAWSA